MDSFSSRDSAGDAFDHQPVCPDVIVRVKFRSQQIRLQPTPDHEQQAVYTIDDFRVETGKNISHPTTGADMAQGDESRLIEATIEVRPQE